MNVIATSQQIAFEFTPNPAARSAAERAELMKDPGFGTVFSDHMAHITWTKGIGWHDFRIVPYGPLSLDPATAVLHYGQEIFEGLKAYRWADGSVRIFRPEANGKRMRRSARRLALPELPMEEFLGSVEALIKADEAWVPDGGDEQSLYLRPFMFASEAYLGVRASRQVDYMIIASVVGPYLAEGPVAVDIWVDQQYHRAGPGGTGTAKCGGNYAAAMLPQEEGYAKGCAQVAFLDAATNTHFDELGGMNMYVVLDDGTVVTPALTDTILPGITRSSILTLASEQGHRVEERELPLTEVLDGAASGRIREVFACGTAAIISPIGRLKGRDFDCQIADGKAGELTLGLREQLTGIQYGRCEDTHGWMHRII